MRSVPSFFVLTCLAFVGCSPDDALAPPSAADSSALGSAPAVLVLGTAQDGGFPHAACHGPRCETARKEGGRAIASLAILLPDPARVYLIDATPDIRTQLDTVHRVRSREIVGVDRNPIDGLFLTHAHMGHYTGLAFLGYEAVHTSDLPVHCTDSMADYLRSNGPWSQLVEKNEITLLPMNPDSPVQLGRQVSVTAIRVPHRDEYSDTVGFLIRGPHRTLLYIPDTDPWSAWSTPLTDLLADVDIALLDGTFYSADELPGRAVSSIGHPLITDSMTLLAPLVDNGLQVFFTHLNHSNPALDPTSPESTEIHDRNFAVLDDAVVFPL